MVQPSVFYQCAFSGLACWDLIRLMLLLLLLFYCGNILLDSWAHSGLPDPLARSRRRSRSLRFTLSLAAAQSSSHRRLVNNNGQHVQTTEAPPPPPPPTHSLVFPSPLRLPDDDGFNDDDDADDEDGDASDYDVGLVVVAAAIVAAGRLTLWEVVGKLGKWRSLTGCLVVANR